MLTLTSLRVVNFEIHLDASVLYDVPRDRTLLDGAEQNVSQSSQLNCFFTCFVLTFPHSDETAEPTASRASHFALLLPRMCGRL